MGATKSQPWTNWYSHWESGTKQYNSKQMIWSKVIATKRWVDTWESSFSVSNWKKNKN